MSKIIAAALLVTITLISLSALAEAANVSSNDLIEKAKEYDGQEIVFAGEVIGDIMNRGEYSWINVSDGLNAIGIWVPNRLVSGITLAGKYKVHGDEVRITGVFHRACPEHGGDLDIHAGKIELLKTGYPVEDGMEPWKLPAAAVLLFSTLILFSCMIKKRRGLKL